MKNIKNVPYEAYAIVSEDEYLCLYTIDDSDFNAWCNFFKVHPNVPCMGEAIKAYEAIGFKCIKITIDYKNIKLKAYKPGKHICCKCGDYEY